MSDSRRSRPGSGEQPIVFVAGLKQFQPMDQRLLALLLAGTGAGIKQMVNLQRDRIAAGGVGLLLRQRTAAHPVAGRSFAALTRASWLSSSLRCTAKHSSATAAKACTQALGGLGINRPRREQISNALLHGRASEPAAGRSLAGGTGAGLGRPGGCTDKQAQGSQTRRIL